MLKNGLRICPRIDDLALTLTWTSPRDWLLADILVLCPVGFSFFSGHFLHLFELLLQQRALVIELMDVSRSKVKQRLVRSAVIVESDVTASLRAPISHQDSFPPDRSLPA
jgi:hypothetical protein